MKKKLKWCQPLGEPLILGVAMINVEVNDSGVGGHVGTCFRGLPDCVGSLLGNKPHGGRQKSRWRDGTGKNGWLGEVGVENVEVAVICKGGKGRRCLGCSGCFMHNAKKKITSSRATGMH